MGADPARIEEIGTTLVNVPRLVSMMLAAFVAVVLAAAPALAQQDPFEPRDPGRGGDTEQEADPGAGETGGGDTDGTQQAQEAPDTGRTTEGLPETGADPKPWIVLAYGLIAIGAGLVTVARTLRVSPLAVRPSPRTPDGGARSAGSSR
ncbi:MAG: hypothetical protein ACRDJ5_02205 [Actinomycetota bacterium]